MNVPIQNRIQKEKKYLFMAVLLTLGLFIAYVYLLSSSVVEVVIRKEMNREMQDLHTEISQLETTYIEKQHSVSNEIAVRQGFVEAKNKIFINRGDTGLALSSN